MGRWAACSVLVLLVGTIGGAAAGQEASANEQAGCFSTIVVQNPNDTAAVVNVICATPCDPTAPDYQVTIPANGRGSINVSEAISNPWIGSTLVSSDVPIVAVQNTIQSSAQGGQWIANEGGVLAPAKTWYLAEGSTYGGYQTSITVQNPGMEPAQVSIRYTVPGGSQAGHEFTVLPVSRQQVQVADTLPDWSSIGAIVTASVPIVAQMSVVGNDGTTMASSMGVSQLSTTWYLAEGSTSPWSGFETWIMVQNPGTAPADVTVAYIAEGAEHPGPSLTIPPMTHDLFNAANSLPDQPHFATVIKADQPIVAVQSMIWDDEKGRDPTMGVTAPSQKWIFPVARPFSGASAWLSVQNVGSTSVDVTISYVNGSRTFSGPDLALEPFSKDSLSLPETVESSTDYSVIVTSDQPIVALQGTYWETSYGVHRDLCFGTPFAAETWYLPALPSCMSSPGP